MCRLSRFRGFVEGEREDVSAKGPFGVPSAEKKSKLPCQRLEKTRNKFEIGII